jgi:uncharacterized protein YjlB
MIAISDDRLDPGWYRIISAGGTEMPTEAPGTFRCKTWYPIWLDGIYNYSLYGCLDIAHLFTALTKHTCFYQ